MPGTLCHGWSPVSRTKGGDLLHVRASRGPTDELRAPTRRPRPARLDAQPRRQVASWTRARATLLSCEEVAVDANSNVTAVPPQACWLNQPVNDPGLAPRVR